MVNDPGTRSRPPLPVKSRAGAVLCVAVGLGLSARLAWAAEPSGFGRFDGQTDIGAVGKPGSLQFDSAAATYLIAGGGGNMWFTNDALHYVWKRVSGDVALAADISWAGTGGN